jgi:hypothetical protein
MLMKVSGLWSNQGAVCIYPGIVDRLWSENGILVKIATVSGNYISQIVTLGAPSLMKLLLYARIGLRLVSLKLGTPTLKGPC